MDWITAHAKAIIAAIGAVLILVLDQQTVDIIVGALTTLSVLLVPNNQPAVERIYHRDRLAGEPRPPRR
jgi:hypothetical protein